MHVAQQDQFAFYLTGRSSAATLTPVEGRGLVPALAAPYRDMAALRHDFPLLLVPDKPAETLSEAIGAALAATSQTAEADRLRGHARRMEAALRRLVSSGEATGLSEAWELAVSRLDQDDGLPESLERLRVALPRDGLLLDCDAGLPGQLVGHTFALAQQIRTERLRSAVAELVMRLDAILRADFAASPAARSPSLLRAGIGPAQQHLFDFAAMAKVLEHSGRAGTLEVSRRRRIEWLLEVLRGQRFAPLPGSGAEQYEFTFGSCAAALAAWRERLPDAAELARALAMARLEAAGEYDEARHDAVFASFGAESRAVEAGLPDYLVCLDAGTAQAEAGLVLQAFAAGLPFKVLAQRDDLLQVLPGALGLAADPLAMTALSLGRVFVLQLAAARLPAEREQLRAGVEFAGPALFHVFSGAGAGTAGLPPYLVSAAAVESRAFPGFVQDPQAGEDAASRFALLGNPQPEADWPVHPLAWEDAAHRRGGEDVAFTLVDFLACDRRAGPHLAGIAREAWNDRLVPVAQALAGLGGAEQVPVLWMANAEGGLVKVVADEMLMTAARRGLARWRALQELAGIRNSHAARAVAAARAEWETARPPASAPAPAPEAASAEPPAAEPDASPERDPTLAFIETARCSSCNECIRINDRMFGYDANKQARILDVKAGPYRQLVEAAESCQVSVIHPGKPLEPNEPGLEELLRRAEPFL